MRKDNRSLSKISKHYGVSPSTVWRIKKGIQWGHITRDNIRNVFKHENNDNLKTDKKIINKRELHQVRGDNVGTSKLSEPDVVAILKDTRLQRIIAKEYGVSVSAISHIKTRKTWAHL